MGQQGFLRLHLSSISASMNGVGHQGVNTCDFTNPAYVSSVSQCLSVSVISSVNKVGTYHHAKGQAHTERKRNVNVV